MSSLLFISRVSVISIQSRPILNIFHMFKSKKKHSILTKINYLIDFLGGAVVACATVVLEVTGTIPGSG